ncbi:MAG: hypothetical protein PW788_05625 [Micavibrio sp.]|nr:hypothetical protein [Micavibrio sp.]
MSEWDDLDPHEKRAKRMYDPASAARMVAADTLLIEALLQSPIDLPLLHKALQADANPDRTIINGYPALHVALHRHDTKAVDLLLRYAANTNDVNSSGYNALDEAYRTFFTAGIKALKQHGAETRVLAAEEAERADIAADIYAPSYQSRINAFLFHAAGKGTAEQVRQALALGADANAQDIRYSPSFTPLLHAVAWVDAEKTKILLDAGANPNGKSSDGRDVIDMLWTAGTRAFDDSWVQLYKTLQDRGYTNIFLKQPEELTFDDLMEPVMTGPGKDKPTKLHYLVAHGKSDAVFDILARSSNRRLTAADLQKKEPYYRNETLLTALASQKQLTRIFTAAIWQGRVEEMMSLQKPVETDFNTKGTVDFDKARAEVMNHRLKDMKARAPKLKW